MTSFWSDDFSKTRVSLVLPDNIKYFGNVLLDCIDFGVLFVEKSFKQIGFVTCEQKNLFWYVFLIASLADGVLRNFKIQFVL